MKLAATEYRDAGEILSMTRMSRASWTLEQDDQACTSVKSVYTTGRETFTTIVEVSRREDGSILVNQTDIVIDGIGGHAELTPNAWYAGGPVDAVRTERRRATRRRRAPVSRRGRHAQTARGGRR